MAVLGAKLLFIEVPPQINEHYSLSYVQRDRFTRRAALRVKCNFQFINSRKKKLDTPPVKYGAVEEVMDLAPLKV